MSLRVENATSTVITSGADATVAVARPTRRQITIRNNGTLTDTIYINMDAAATSANFTLGAGQVTVFLGTGAWHIAAGTGTPTVSIMDEYD